jgi:hypothetical protein
MLLAFFYLQRYRKEVLTDLYKHEVIHREFFKTVLTLGLPNPKHQLLPELSFNYGNLDFNSNSGFSNR